MNLPHLGCILVGIQIKSYFGTTVWHGYLNQPAAQIIRLAPTQTAFNVSGSGMVAVIDTGVDPNHPVLKNVLVSGYDFTRDRDGMPDEKGDLNQSTAEQERPYLAAASGKDRGIKPNVSVHSMLAELLRSLSQRYSFQPDLAFTPNGLPPHAGPAANL